MAQTPLHPCQGVRKYGQFRFSLSFRARDVVRWRDGSAASNRDQYDYGEEPTAPAHTLSERFSRGLVGDDYNQDLLPAAIPIDFTLSISPSIQLHASFVALAPSCLSSSL